MSINRTDFSKYIPYMTMFLIFSGIVYGMLYYGYFNLNILPFLDIDEILLLFMNDMLIIAIGITIILGLGYKIIKSVEENDKFKYKKNFKWVYISSNTIIYLLVYVYKTIKHHRHFELINAGSAFVMTLLVFCSSPFLLYLVKKKLLWGIKSKTLIVCYLMLTFLFVFWLGGVLNASAIQKGPNFRATYNVTLIGDRKIQTNDSIIYLGSTRNFIIFNNTTVRLKFKMSK